MSKEVTAESYTLTTKSGDWLGQVVITSDGMFSGVTDWGNFGYAWRSFGDDFKSFLMNIEVDYFATKMSTGMAYVAHSRKVDQAAQRFAEKILPALKQVLIQENKEKVSA